MNSHLNKRNLTTSTLASNKLSIFLITFLLSISITAYTQNEFTTYANGFIYSESAMLKLKKIVDSLNLKHKICDINKVFYSQQQTIAHVIWLDTGDIEDARKYLDANCSFDDFIAKFSMTRVEKNALILKNRSTNYKNKKVVQYSQLQLKGYGGLDIELPDKKGQYERELKNTWLYNYDKGSEDYGPSLSAFYFPDSFKSTPLKQEYCRQISYSECLIDTSTEKLKKELNEGDAQLPKNWLNLGLKEKEKLLEKLRSTKVIGQCSMDSRPREHAANIALLSAETINWEVFLKSHLDIMNDRFDRVSDGSYAYAARKTYIKELEELNINVRDLLLGISFRVENPATRHYYGSIWRLGRAISESLHKQEFENQLLAMIADDELDTYNRLMAYFLFLNYSHFLSKPAEQQAATAKLKTSLSTLPMYFRERLLSEEK